jgi:hypothetical protein
MGLDSLDCECILHLDVVLSNSQVVRGTNKYN